MSTISVHTRSQSDNHAVLIKCVNVDVRVSNIDVSNVGKCNFRVTIYNS